MKDIRDRSVNLPIDSKCKKFALKSPCTLLDSILTFRETHSNQFHIIFFHYCSRFASSKDCGLHCYMNDIRGRNVNLPIDSKCKNFALESRCTLLDSIWNLITFRETYSNECYVILFVCCSRFVSCKDRGLHFYMNDIRDRNVNLPIDSKCENFGLKSLCTLLYSI